MTTLSLRKIVQDMQSNGSHNEATRATCVVDKRVCLALATCATLLINLILYSRACVKNTALQDYLIILTLLHFRFVLQSIVLQP